ncbi:MAG TPA: hypothetical protein VJB70_02910 [Candidatus Paceibacterota bacterium]
MREKSEWYKLRDAICDHEDNVGRDAHEKHALYKQVSKWSLEELQSEMSCLDDGGGPTKIV